MDKRFAAVVLFAMLSCFSSVSTYYVHPVVSRTPDAIIIDFFGVRFAPFYLGIKDYDPGFIPLNPQHPLVQQQQLFFIGPYDFKQAAVQCGKGATTTPTSGKRKRSLILDGRLSGTNAINAKNRVWTFMVALNVNGAFFCSGTLISSTKVLLAAQCFEKMSLYQMSTVTVSVGSFLALQTDAQMTRRVSKVVLHGQYNSATYANDIAIVTLDMPVIFSGTVGPVCLPPASTDPDQYAGQAAVILGWDKGATPASADVLQQSLELIDLNSNCRTESTFGQYVTNSTTCISSSGTSTCLNDVGGPLLINSATTSGTTAVWTQIGINSFNSATSTSCTSSGLKTLVSAFVPWITTYRV